LVNKRVREFLDEAQYKIEFNKSFMKSGKTGSKTDIKSQDPKQSKTTKVEKKEEGNKMEEELKAMVTQLIEKSKEDEIKNSKLTNDMNNMMDLMKQTIKELESMVIKDETTEVKKDEKEDIKEEDIKPLPMPPTPIAVHANTVKEPKKNFENIDVR